MVCWRVPSARIWIATACVAALSGASACARQATPADPDTANTACRFCRMTVSDVRFAAQIAAPGAEPVFFDDIGCLRDYLKRQDVSLPPGAVTFVADHRTGAWVRAVNAVFTRPATLETPMGGGIIAHAGEDSRRQDPDAAGGTSATVTEIFGSTRLSGGGRP